MLPYKSNISDPAFVDESKAVALGVLTDIQGAYPIATEAPNFNGPLPQVDDVQQAYRFEGIGRADITAQYVRAVSFQINAAAQSVNASDENSRARTQVFGVDHRASSLVAQWIGQHGTTPITRAFLGLEDSAPAPAPPRTAKAAIAQAKAALATLEAFFS